jgi:ferredoxin-like protein FixX
MKMTDEQKNKKVQEYAIVLIQAIQQAFDKESDIPHIDINDFADDDNFKCFTHSLANIVPNSIFSKLSGQEKDNLEFNHLANHLCFEFGTIIPNK